MPLKIETDQTIGDYQVEHLLGQGGMAIVYLAHDRTTCQPVAIKFLNLDALPAQAAGEAARRFDLEVRQLTQLHHPNIVQVLASGYHDQVPYLIMNYVAGGTLKDRMGAPLPWREAVRWIRPLVDALRVAHESGVMHRDVKPANVLIMPDGTPVLSDFGIAKTFGDGTTTLGATLTATGVVVGTPEYMAPEQARGIGFDQRVDIYALGIVLYELITGKRPFTAQTPIEVLVKHMTEPLPRPRQSVPGLPRQVETVMLTALAKQPAARYQTMAAFGQALDALQQRSPRPEAPPIVWLGRAIAGLAGVGAVVALASLVNWPQAWAAPTATPTISVPRTSRTATQRFSGPAVPVTSVEATASESAGSRVTPSLTRRRLTPSATVLASPRTPTPTAPPSQTPAAPVISAPTRATATLGLPTETSEPTPVATLPPPANTSPPPTDSVPPTQTPAPPPTNTSTPPPIDTSVPPPTDTSAPPPTRPPTPTA